MGALTLTVGVIPGSDVASAAPPAGNGCGYGTGGPFADTLCWIDLSGYNDSAARSGAGQPLTATLPGGYEVDFTVRTSGDRGVTPVGFPSWDYGAAIGKYIYLGTPGQPALYQSGGFGPGSTTISLTDISVTDSGGNAVTGWRLVGADAEATADSESITFSSDAPVDVLATYTPDNGFNGCQINVTQVDANTIRCTGSAVGDRYGTVLVGATEPTSFTQVMTVGNAVSREAVAFAFQSSVLSLEASVSGRVDASDTFLVEVLSPESTVIGASGTAGSDIAGTGDIVVLPRVDGSSYTMRLTGYGSPLSAYDVQWTCTVDDVVDPSLSASNVASITVSPEAGEQIACFVAIFYDGGPISTTTTTTPSSTTTTTTAPPSSSTTTTPVTTPPVVTTTPGTAPVASTSSTTTTVAPSTTVPVETTTTTEVVVDPGSTVPPLTDPPLPAPAPPAPPAVSPQTAYPRALPRTGSDDAVPLTLVGTALLGLGLVVLRAGQRRTATR